MFIASLSAPNPVGRTSHQALDPPFMPRISSLIFSTTCMSCSSCALSIYEQRCVIRVSRTARKVYTCWFSASFRFDMPVLSEAASLAALRRLCIPVICGKAPMCPNSGVSSIPSFGLVREARDIAIGAVRELRGGGYELLDWAFRELPSDEKMASPSCCADRGLLRIGVTWDGSKVEAEAASWSVSRFLGARPLADMRSI